MEKTRRIYIRKDVYAKLEVLAKLNGESVSDYVNRLIMDNAESLAID